MMTRKDYVLLALHLKRALEAVKGQQPAVGNGVAQAISAVANALASDNPRFDRDRFLSAAGVVADTDRGI